MNLGRFLAEKKTDIIKSWFKVIIETYPADTAAFLKKQQNRFTNPVGSTIYQGIEKIFDEVLSDADFEKVSPFLDNIIRIRAVQDFTPSKAVSFIFSLKGVILQELEENKITDIAAEELRALDDKIDALALLTFDIFMRCREKIYEVKSNELRNMTFRLLQRANKLDEAKEENPEPRRSSND
jgi:RsbT co-antagonist protein rsbRD N-terminal domain